MKDQPKVFFNILNYNDGKETLKNCLRSVFEIDYPNFFVTVVDNDSSDGSLEEAKRCFPQVKFIKNEKNLGFAAANNIGLKIALENKTDYAILLNNDTLVEKDFLTKLIEIGEKDKKIGIICPLIFEGDKKRVWFSSGKIDWFRMKTFHGRKKISKICYNSGFISGCAMLVRADVLRKIGFLDEDYFLYWEDADFSYRTKKAGFKTAIVPESVIYHLEQSKAHSLKKTYWLVLSGLLFFEKNSPWFFRPWIAFYVNMRRLKNWLDRKRKKGELSEAVYKAYCDFQNGKR